MVSEQSTQKKIPWIISSCLFYMFQIPSLKSKYSAYLVLDFFEAAASRTIASARSIGLWDSRPEPFLLRMQTKTIPWHPVSTPTKRACILKPAVCHHQSDKAMDL
jgi:hypothetical protein